MKDKSQEQLRHARASQGRLQWATGYPGLKNTNFLIRALYRIDGFLAGCRPGLFHPGWVADATYTFLPAAAKPGKKAWSA